MSAPDQADVDFLLQAGTAAHMPVRPFCDPGKSRYEMFDFDKRELLTRCALSIAVRKEVVFLSSVAGLLDHYEFFGIEPTEDRRKLRDAYVAFNRRLHPDAYYGKDLGPFGERLQWVVGRGAQIWEWLRTDERLRGAYARYVIARNEAFYARFEAKQEALTAESSQAEEEERAARKAELRSRLRRNRARLQR